MKIKNLFLALLIIKICFVGAQNIKGIINYNITSQIKTDPDLSPNVNRLIQLANEGYSFLTFKLITNGNESLFELIPNLTNDSNALSIRTAKATSNGNGVWYLNIESQERLLQRDIFGEVFLIKSSLKDDEWVFQNETKKIGDYVAFKATTFRTEIGSNGLFKREIIVWYTPDIAIPFGPIGLGGLPGLILEANIGKVTYHLKNIKVSRTKDNFKIEPPNKGKSLSEQEFHRLSKKRVMELKASYGRN